jgi:ATP-dependent helicase/nuclease subunit A
MSDLYAMPRNLVLAASAGTGKTHALVGVIVHLLLGARKGGAVDPARVVATTFSRKAAAEIRTRVANEVEMLAREPSRSRYVIGLRDHGLRDGEIEKRARRALTRLPLARFGTLHSFATGIVQRYAVELGLGPGFELTTDADARLRAEEAIARALEARLGTQDAELRSLAEAAGGLDRLVATLRRILSQLEEDGRPARELETGDRDSEILERQLRTLLAHARDLHAHPRLADAARELRSAWERSDLDALENAAAALTAVPDRGKRTPELESFFVFRAELPGMTNAEKGRRLVRAFRAREAFPNVARLVREVLADAEEEIERLGRMRASLGFGEVLRAARELLRDRPDVAIEVGASLDALLVDEFQDTSRVQRDLLQLLWARPEARSAGHVPPLSAMRDRGLLVVGDRKQSIYGFRGADVAVFAELAVGLAGAPAREALGIPPGVAWEPKEPPADFHALRHNRRSDASILAFANAFSARRFAIAEPPPELFEIAYVPATEDLLSPPETPPAEATTLTTWLRVTPKKQTSTRLEEALVIAAHVQTLHATWAFRDIAVLATTNGMLDAMAFAFAQADVPYVVAGKSFFRAREVSDLAAMLALVLDPTDRLAALEVLRGPWAGVHDETLLALVEPGRGLVGPARWVDPPAQIRDEDRASLRRVASLVTGLARSAGRLGAGEILWEAVAASGFDAVLARMPRGTQRVANVLKLLAMADRHPDARAFVAWLVEAKEQEVAESEAATFSDQDDAVRLLTIHASKGLDFPVVYIPEIAAGPARLEKGVARLDLGSGDAKNRLCVRIADDAGFLLEPPSFAQAYENTRRRERAERQRLAYVAVTRAAKRMFLVGGRSSEAEIDPGASTLGACLDISSDLLAIEDVDVPAPAIRGAAIDDGPLEPAARIDARVPAFKRLPIAPTALADFAHCARRFELVHLLGLPERARGRAAPSERGSEVLFDARAQGTLAHVVLERLPYDAFVEANPDEVTSLLETAGVPVDHPQHAAIAARALRFLRSSYTREIGERRAAIAREVAFVCEVRGADDRSVTLRGSMDLLVTWPDGRVDVVDYKSARGGDTDSYAFQLDVYALAARELHPAAVDLRAGLAFLGAGSGEPSWRTNIAPIEVRARIASLGASLVEARWTRSFPRAPLERCASIHCGFVGRCHPNAEQRTDR